MKIHFFKSAELSEKYPQESDAVYYSLPAGGKVMVFWPYLREIRGADDLLGLLIAIWRDNAWEFGGGHYAVLTVEE